VAWSFKAHGMEREGVVGAHVAVLLDEEQFVIRFVGRQEADAVAVQGKAVQRAHAQHGMKVGEILKHLESEGYTSKAKKRYYSVYGVARDLADQKKIRKVEKEGGEKLFIKNQPF
jgi:hypothetical protein